MKIVNFVLGFGTAIILSSLIILGIKAFYPEPVAPQYLEGIYNAPMQQPCANSDVVCQKLQTDFTIKQQAAQAQYNKDQQVYQDQLSVYNKNLFIIANIVGILVFVFGFWLLFATEIAAQSVPIGIMISGLWSIIYGYERGWGSVNDQLKFFIGLIIAILVIGGSMWLMQRYAKKQGA
jgi:uncharacterized membrane protein